MHRLPVNRPFRVAAARCAAISRVAEARNADAAVAALLAAAGAVTAASFGFYDTTTAVHAAAKPASSYSPGQAIGEGLKGDLWKAKHPNVQILELEDGPLLSLLSYVRNAETEGTAFVSYAERAMRFLLEAAWLELPADDEAEFLTPSGATMQGVQLEDGVDVLAVTLLTDGEQPGMWDRPLRHTFPGAAAASVRVKHFQASPVVHKETAAAAASAATDADSGEAQQTVLLLAGVVASAETVLAALESLAEAGVEEDDVILVSLVMSMPACEKLSREAKGLTIIAGAVDPTLDAAAGVVLPGAGDVASRYFAALEDSRAAGSLAGSDAAPAGRRRRFWIF